MNRTIFGLFTFLLQAFFGYAADEDLSGSVHPQAFFKAFETSLSPEDFEKRINDPAGECHNLDLNRDGEIDYLRVEDLNNGSLHVLVIRAVLQISAEQDILRIELEQTGPEEVIVELVGDDDIFPEGLILEPGEDESHKSKGPMPIWATYPSLVRANAWMWPVVRFMYAPVYRPYSSPWRWAYYPPVWRPRRVLAGSDFLLIKRKAYPGYRIVKARRIARSAVFYRPYRRAYLKGRQGEQPGRKAPGRGHGRGQRN